MPQLMGGFPSREISLAECPTFLVGLINNVVFETGSFAQAQINY